jgi:hypothetical protein
MKITIESTTKTVTVNGVHARIWEGKTDSGIPIHCFVTRIAVHPQNHSEFERELQSHRAPSEEAQVWPRRMIL